MSHINGSNGRQTNPFVNLSATTLTVSGQSQFSGVSASGIAVHSTTPAPIGGGSVELTCVESDLGISGFYTTPSTYFNSCNKIHITANTMSFINAGVDFAGYDNEIHLTDLGAFGTNGGIYAFRSIVNASGTWSMANPPLYFEFKNPKATQSWSSGFFNVTVAGSDSGSSVACRTATNSSANQIASQTDYGYQGYCKGSAGGVGGIVGVNAIAAPYGNHTFSIGLDAHGSLLGNGTPKDRIMGVRCNGHNFTLNGSLVAVSGASRTTPSAVTTTHLNFTGSGGELYIESNAEIDGELFCDGNETSSITAVTGNYTAGSRTYITASGTITVTLPAISGKTGRRYIIKNKGTGTVTVDGNASETIDGSLTQPVGPKESIQIINDGTEWVVF